MFFRSFLIGKMLDGPIRQDEAKKRFAIKSTRIAALSVNSVKERQDHSTDLEWH